MSHHLPDATKMINDTPRTDAVWEKFETDLRGELEPDVEFSTLARQLERELNAANAEIEEKRKDVVWLATEKAKLENYVMRLEDAGDDLYANCDPSRWDSTETTARKLADQNAWLKAKEDKP